jgi:cyanophycin synthetase
LQVKDIHALNGPNLHSYQPVIEMLVDLGEYDGQLTTELGQFSADLLSAIPSLTEHYCTRGRKGGFVERLHEGTLLGHVIEHVALELQTLAGLPVVYGKTRRSGTGSTYNVIIEYRCREAALYAAQAAVDVIERLLSGQHVAVGAVVARVSQLAGQYDLGPSTSALAAAARRRHIPVMRLNSGSLLQLGYGVSQRRLQATMTGLTSCVAVDIATDKELTKQILKEHGVPVPEGGVATSEAEAVGLAVRLGVPVAVKPCDGNQGKGVTLDVQRERDVRRAFRCAAGFGDRVIVEQYIVGRHYRVLVVGDQVVAVSERVPAHVVGDGTSSVASLVQQANADPRRGEGHQKPLTRLVLDATALRVLGLQQLGPHHTPSKGQAVYLRQNANLSTGGVAYDATDEICPANARLAVRAAQIIGLDVAGVDVVAADIAQDLLVTGGAVIEVNAAPGIRMHHYPMRGRARDVAGAIVDHLFPAGTCGRIPLVAVTGTNGKTTVTRMIASMGKKWGKFAGCATSDGIYLDGERVQAGDRAGPRSARAVLQHPKVEMAVLETARGGIIRNGLGFDRCEVAVVTNIGDDHLGQDGVEDLEDLCDVKALVVEVVTKKGAAVLNADDPAVCGLAGRARSEVIYFSLQSDNLTIRKHLMKGGRAVYVRRSCIHVAIGSKDTRFLPIRLLPSSFGGRYRPNVANALAATAAGLALGIPLEVIKAALKEFAPDATCNPGRLNLAEAGGISVCVDYAHNVPALLATARCLRSMTAGRGRCIGVIASPGDRPDAAIERLGQAAATVFDLLFIKEDADLRGRRPGETAALLKEGALATAPTLPIEVVLDEAEAITRALAQARAGDMVVVLYEKYERTVSVLAGLGYWLPEQRPEGRVVAGEATQA